jgi:hypothetical protein
MIRIYSLDCSLTPLDSTEFAPSTAFSLQPNIFLTQNNLHSPIPPCSGYIFNSLSTIITDPDIHSNLIDHCSTSNNFFSCITTTHSLHNNTFLILNLLQPYNSLPSTHTHNTLFSSDHSLLPPFHLQTLRWISQSLSIHHNIPSFIIGSIARKPICLVYNNFLLSFTSPFNHTPLHRFPLSIFSTNDSPNDQLLLEFQTPLHHTSSSQTTTNPLTNITSLIPTGTYLPILTFPPTPLDTDYDLFSQFSPSI